MGNTLSRLMDYPRWAHAEYESEYDGIRELADTLTPGDVVQVNDRKEPLSVERREDDTIHFELNDPFERERVERGYSDTEYRLERDDGRKYGTYFSTGPSRRGVDEMGVIYRSDGSLSEYTVGQLDEMIEAYGKDALYEVTWEEAEVNHELIETPQDRPQRKKPVGEVEKAEDVIPSNPTRRRQRAAAKRLQSGEDVEDIDEYTSRYEFVEKTQQATLLIPPTGVGAVDGVPGALFFRTGDTNRHPRRVVPLDRVANVELIDAAV